MGYKDLTTWQRVRIVVPVMASPFWEFLLYRDGWGEGLWVVLIKTVYPRIFSAIIRACNALQLTQIVLHWHIFSRVTLEAPLTRSQTRPDTLLPVLLEADTINNAKNLRRRIVLNKQKAQKFRLLLKKRKPNRSGHLMRNLMMLSMCNTFQLIADMTGITRRPWYDAPCVLHGIIWSVSARTTAIWMYGAACSAVTYRWL